MRDLGATRWDPTPVDQHDFFLDEIPGESALQRALAWMRAHTIRRGRWKAYAVDEKGQELSIERLAADLGWKVKWAQEVWRAGEGHGLFRREKQFPSRLYLSGKVIRRASHSSSDEYGKVGRCTTDSSSFVLPGYLDRQMARWKPERRTAAVARLARRHQWKELVMRDGVSALREITEQHDDILLRDLGLEKRHQPKRREPQRTVRVVLLADPESQVDLFTGAGEETKNSEPDVVQPQHSAAQTPSPPDSPTVVQGGLYEGNRSSVPRSEADVHRPQHGVQVVVGEVDEAAAGAPPLTSLETTRGKGEPSSSFSEPNVSESERSTTTSCSQVGVVQDLTPSGVFRSGAIETTMTRTEDTRKASTTTRPPSSFSSAQPGTSTAPERETQPAREPEPAGMPDEEFAANMTRIFVENGKDNPTHKQIRYVMAHLPDHPGARPEFLFTLQEKVGRLDHPGSLPFVVEGFNAKWPQLLKMLEAESQPGGKRQRSLSRSDEVRSHLHKNVEALRQAGCPEVADQVEDMAAGPLDDEEDVERRLGILEQKMIEILRGRQSEQDAIAAHKSLKSQLSPYRSKMTADQLAMLERQYLDRDLLEKAKIPRLSLFYL